jgi:dTDP-4-amino-4,6-dideoxygalactose transaminase
MPSTEAPLQENKKRQKGRMRHLPPTAVSLTRTDLQAGLKVGPETLDNFRAALADYLGVAREACFLAASGRTALYYLLSFLRSNSPARTKVIMPAYTCPALAKVTLDVGLKPVFVDISPITLNFDQVGLVSALDDQALAVIAVHPFGISLPIDGIDELAKAAGAVLIEDAAQAMGARWEGQAVGTRGDFGLFSLGPGKPLSTAGGGVLIANEATRTIQLEDFWHTIPRPSSLVSGQAWARQAMFHLAFHPRGWWAATRVGLHTFGDHESSWGYKEQGLTSTQAAVGAALLLRLDQANALRRENAQALVSGLEQIETVSFISIPEATEPIYLRLPLIAKNEQQRRRLFKNLWADGIGVGRMYKRTLPAIFPGHSEGSFPGAEIVAKNLLTLPTHHYVTPADIHRMQSLLVNT